MVLKWYRGNPKELTPHIVAQNFCLIVLPGERIQTHCQSGEYLARKGDDISLVPKSAVHAIFLPRVKYGELSDYAAFMERPQPVIDVLADLALYSEDNNCLPSEASRQRALMLAWKQLPIWEQSNKRPKDPNPGWWADYTAWADKLLHDTQSLLATIKVAPVPGIAREKRSRRLVRHW